MAIDAPERPVMMAMLEENRVRLRGELEPRIAAFEARYELPSSQIMGALATGSLSDTADVCDWLIAWETYVALGGPTQLE